MFLDLVPAHTNFGLAMLLHPRWLTLSLELMTPASAALGVPCLAEPGEGVGQGWASKSTISGVSGRPQGEPYSCATRGIAWNSGGGGGLGRRRYRNSRQFPALHNCTVPL